MFCSCESVPAKLGSLPLNTACHILCFSHQSLLATLCPFVFTFRSSRTLLRTALIRSNSRKSIRSLRMSSPCSATGCVIWALHNANPYWHTSAPGITVCKLHFVPYAFLCSQTVARAANSLFPPLFAFRRTKPSCPQ